MKYMRGESLLFFVFRLSTIISVLVLLLVFVLLYKSGASVITWQFLTADWNHTDITRGGIFPAIVGSLYLGLGVMLVSFPMGIATAIYITEYTTNYFWKRITQLAIRNLAGVPSVIYGIFGLAVFVHALELGTSLISAILTLSIMTLPWIISASVEAFESIPSSLQEASFALGATRWQTIRFVVLPLALPNCITGGIIGNARAMGETAPIIMVGATFYVSTLPSSPFDKFMALPYHTFILATQHSSPFALKYAAGTALVLIALTFALSFIAIMLRYYFRLNKQW